MKRMILFTSFMIAVALSSSYGQARSLDSTFGVDGRYVAIPEDTGYISGVDLIQLQSDEKIIVVAIKLDLNMVYPNLRTISHLL